MKKQKYSWSRHFKVDAQAFGEWLHALPSRNAETILKEAEDPDCIAHELFVWDDSEAARRYRLYQANIVVNSLQIEIIQPDKKPQHIQAYIRRKDMEVYVPMMEATSDDFTAAEARCWNDMKRFKDRNRGIQFARTVLEAISDVERVVVRTRKRASAG